MHDRLNRCFLPKSRLARAGTPTPSDEIWTFSSAFGDGMVWDKSLQAEPRRCRINRMGWWGRLWWIIYLLSAVNSAFSLGSSHIAWEGTKFPFTKMIQLINGVLLKNIGHWCHTRNTHRQKSFFLCYQILCIFSWEGTVTKKFFIGPICLNDLHSLGLLKKFLHRKS